MRQVIVSSDKVVVDLRSGFKRRVADRILLTFSYRFFVPVTLASFLGRQPRAHFPQREGGTAANPSVTDFAAASEASRRDRAAARAR